MTYAIFAVPAPGREVRDPDSKQLIPHSGQNVSSDDLFYTRRFRDGDLLIGEVRWDNPWPPTDPATQTIWDGGATVWDQPP